MSLEIKIDNVELRLIHDALRCHLANFSVEEELANSRDEVETLTIKIYGAIQDYNFSRKEIITNEWNRFLYVWPWW